MVDVCLKNVVSHLINGTLEKSLCRVCLAPLDEGCENVFTEIWKDEKSYRIADILEVISQIKLNPDDNYCVCFACFHMASIAYKFHRTCQHTESILGFYLYDLESNIDVLEKSENYQGGSIGISLPLIEAANTFDYNFEHNFILKPKSNIGYFDDKELSNEPNIKNEMLSPKPDAHETDESEDEMFEEVNKSTYEEEINEVIKDNNEFGSKEEEIDEDIIIVLDGNGKRNYYKTNENGELTQINRDERKSYEIVFRNTEVGKNVINSIKERRPKKERKVRSPMRSIECTHCEVKYRFHARLQYHMKVDHDVILYVCKLCKFMTVVQREYQSHLASHEDMYTCDECGRCFKKRVSLVQHLRKHQASTELLVKEGAHVCEICGHVLPDALHLTEHYDKKHVKKYTCFYCGRSYKGELAFETHIKKHEQHLGNSDERHVCGVCQSSFSSAYRLDKHRLSAHGGAPALPCSVPGCERAFKTDSALKAHVKAHTSEFSCETCGRGFVDGRALLWHRRLHTNERPYKCQQCGRSFVTAYRRNAHVMCTHTAPSRRCPLCPALFHLRSMVNTHIKKVHLKAHARGTRSSKWGGVGWHTAPVPLQELSVAVQSDLLDLRDNHRGSAAFTQNSN